MLQLLEDTACRARSRRLRQQRQGGTGRGIHLHHAAFAQLHERLPARRACARRMKLTAIRIVIASPSISCACPVRRAGRPPVPLSSRSKAPTAPANRPCAGCSPSNLGAHACLGTDEAWLSDAFKTRMIRDAEWFVSAMFFLSGCLEQMRVCEAGPKPLIIMDRSLWSTLAVHGAESPERLEILLAMLRPGRRPDSRSRPHPRPGNELRNLPVADCPQERQRPACWMI